jgi:predicted hotdog family 3-hydroxylacyl-ACP dehydratase
VQLDRAWIAAHIPHAGSMCLLDSVESWSADRLVCRAVSHRDADNPLRSHGRLAAACGIEYAAQAMAVHGALIAQGAAQRQGFLASVRGAQMHVCRLDDIAGDLSAVVERSGGDGSLILYDFFIRCADRTLLEGRATVFMNPA